MNNIATVLIALMQYLLPGFLAAWIFHSFTSFPKQSQFERIVQALIFTLIVRCLVASAQYLALIIRPHYSVGAWSSNTDLACAIVIAILLGFCFTFFANNDKFHKLVRKIKISKETSYPSEWYGEFAKTVTYVVLHLTGERRIYGWPKEWPSSPGKGHFSLMDASWLVGEEQTPLSGVECILVPVQEVEMVEFMEKSWEAKNG